MATRMPPVRRIPYLSVLLTLGLGALLAAGATASEKMSRPALETVSGPEIAQGVQWGIRDADAKLAALLPQGLKPMAAFRFVTSGPKPDAASQSPAPEILLKARLGLGPRPGVFVVTRPELPNGTEQVEYWVHGLESDGATVQFRLPVTPLEPVQDVFLVSLPDPLGQDEQAIVPDPQDPAPLGARIPVVLSHGYNGGHSALPFDPNRDQTFSTLAGMDEYRRVFDRVKFYRFAYRPWMPFPELGKRFADLLVANFETGAARPIILVGHSAGGLASRYAAADARLRDHVAAILTMATPHHGAVTSTMLQAHGKIGERIGLVNSILLRIAQKAEPDTPAMRSLGFDNFDGTISAEARLRYSIPVNEALRAFNASDPNVDKITAYMGEIHSLWGRGAFKVKDELNRRALAAFDPSWGTADPIVHYLSGTFAGAGVYDVRSFPGKAHSELVRSPDVLRTLLFDIQTTAKNAGLHGRFEQLAAGASR